MIIIKDTITIFKGSKSVYYISNSTFKNYYFKAKMPAIIDARFAKINVFDTEFKNFK